MDKQKRKSIMRKLKINSLLVAMIIYILEVAGCGIIIDNYSSCGAWWWCKDADGLHIGELHFYIRDGKINYNISIEIEKDIGYGSIWAAMFDNKFELPKEVKPFDEWNECNIIFPHDTTKKWLFKFQGKSIPNNISVIYDTLNNIGDTLIFWDSTDNIFFHFEKTIMYFL